MNLQAFVDYVSYKVIIFLYISTVVSLKNRIN